MDWSRGELRAGLECYRGGQFFEAHEHWELVWLRLAEPEKSFLQALIQVSAAFHHRRRGNDAGALSLMRRALRRLERCPERFGGMAVERLRGGARAWLEALEHGGAELPASYPAMDPTAPGRTERGRAEEG